MKPQGNSKRGSALVEAAMIWPLVFLAVVFVISMMFLLYNQAVVSASLHTGLQQAAGQWTATMREGGDPEEKEKNLTVAAERNFLQKTQQLGPLFQSGQLECRFQFLPVYPRCRLIYTTDYRGGTLTETKRTKAQTSIISIVDEAQIIRNYRYAKELWERKSLQE